MPSPFTDVKENRRKLRNELIDGVFLLVAVVFVALVAITQSATLAAPTTALFTAGLLTPRVKTAQNTIAEELRRPFVAVGTTLTAFLWLLSTTQSRVETMPSTVAETLIVYIGLAVATGVTVATPFVFLLTRLDPSEASSDPSNHRVRDYVTGIACCAVAFLLIWFVFKISEELVGPLENEALLIPFLIVTAPISGWFIVYEQRNRKNR